jgi:hypothetical protein
MTSVTLQCGLDRCSQQVCCRCHGLRRQQSQFGLHAESGIDQRLYAFRYGKKRFMPCRHFGTPNAERAGPLVVCIGFVVEFCRITSDMARMEGSNYSQAS